MRLMMSFVGFSLLTACSSIERPDAYLCGVNAKSMQLRCYNLKSDFDRNGVLKDSAQPMIKPIKSVIDLNAGVYVTPSDFEKIKVYVREMKAYYDKNCKVL